MSLVLDPESVTLADMAKSINEILRIVKRLDTDMQAVKAHLGIDQKDEFGMPLRLSPHKSR